MKMLTKLQEEAVAVGGSRWDVWVAASFFWLDCPLSADFDDPYLQLDFPAASSLPPPCLALRDQRAILHPKAHRRLLNVHDNVRHLGHRSSIRLHARPNTLRGLRSR